MRKFLTFFEVMLCVVALLCLFVSFLLPHVFELRLEKNEESAQVTLKKIISPALENYAKDNNGTYPISEDALIQNNPPYLRRSYSGKIIQGYQYNFDLSNVGYSVSAEPYKCGPKGTGRKSYIVTTGAVFNETDCNQTKNK
ncbi:MAG: hypothetical protein NC829_01170 [Candidatus Omnitrophica bacterium]|nr:hypothetical protein [Candidatus Omnitrophota bacterium]